MANKLPYAEGAFTDKGQQIFFGTCKRSMINGSVKKEQTNCL